MSGEGIKKYGSQEPKINAQTVDARQIIRDLRRFIAEQKTVLETTMRIAPPHAPDHLPDWIVKMGADVVIAPAMTNQVRGLFEYHGLEVVLGIDPASPEDLAVAFLSGDFGDPSLN